MSIDTNKQETKIVDLLERDGVINSEENTEFKQKPYKLRKLSTKDIGPMIKIAKKMDIRRLKTVFNELDLSEISNIINKDNTSNEELQVPINETLDVEEDSKENSKENLGALAKIGGSIIFEIIPLLLDALDNCIGDVNKLLADVANMEIEELENLDLDIYFSMIYDFINKEEFKGFTKVVSKFLNLEK